MYLTRENPVDIIGDTCRRLDVENGPGTNLKIWGDWCEEEPPNPAHPHIVAWVKEQAAQGLHPFVVVDSLIAFFDGQNENDSAEMRAFINQGRILLRAGACGVLFLHHPGKSENSKVYRGSSDLKPAIDAAFYLSNTSDDGRLQRLYLKSWKRRAIKQRHELVLHYTETDGKGTFTVDERPIAPVQTMGAQLRKRCWPTIPVLPRRNSKRRRRLSICLATGHGCL